MPKTNESPVDDRGTNGPDIDTALPRIVAGAGEAAVQQRARILVVDDNMLLAMGTSAMIEDLGHEAVEANTGEVALRLLRDDAGIDLLLTDFQMPGMNGSELAAAALALRPGLPVLITTGYADLPLGSHSGLPRLAKPYAQAQLAGELNRLLR